LYTWILNAGLSFAHVLTVSDADLYKYSVFGKDDRLTEDSVIGGDGVTGVIGGDGVCGERLPRDINFIAAVI